jgi:protease-4
MSDFIIRVLKWLAALVTAYFILFALLFLVLIGIGVAFQPAPMSVEPNSVLVLDLGFNLTDRPEGEDPAAIIQDALSGELRHSASLRNMLETLEKAGNDAAIHGLLIVGNLQSDGYGGSFASLKEFRQGIVAFGEKKPVWSFLKFDSMRDYYIKSAATEMVTDAHSFIDFRGLRAERLYWGDAFERVGIEFQIEAVGDYKTAGETFVQTSMSDAEREQLEGILGGLWDDISGDIAASRGVAAADLDKIAGSQLFNIGKEAVDNHLVDTLMSEDKFIDYLVGKVGFDSEGETFLQFDFFDYSTLNDPLAGLMDLETGDNKVAVLYIEGMIIDGGSSDGFVGADTVNGYLRELRYDNSVQAVVLRVNSPGGSASASHRIAREIELLNEAKPVVVSMGGIAASGGYMISAVGDYIFAEPTTVTGSIGVVSMIPNVEELAKKLSLSFDGVETHPFAGSFSLTRAKTPEELRQVRAIGEQGYDDFLQLVAVNRGMTRNELLPYAGGRVWAGRTAAKANLVDEMGGLMDAVHRAADLAGIGDSYKIIERPKVLSFEEKLEELFMASSMVKAPNRKGQLSTFVSDIEAEVQRLAALNDPQGLYFLMPYTLKIQ